MSGLVRRKARGGPIDGHVLMTLAEDDGGRIAVVLDDGRHVYAVRGNELIYEGVQSDDEMGSIRRGGRQDR